MSRIKYLVKKAKKIVMNVFATRSKGGTYYMHDSVKVKNMSNIVLDKKCELWEHVIIRNNSSKVRIGENTQVGPFTVVFAGLYGVTIMKNVIIAPHVVIAAGIHKYDNTNIPMRFSGSSSEGEIIIEEDVWICANCTIGDGVKIGKGSIISANSFVNKDVAPYSIVGGVPAKVIGSRK